MSRSPLIYDTGKVDWAKVLEPSRQMQDERAVKNAVTEDLLNMTEAVRLGKTPEEIWENLNLSRATGLPFSTVEEDKDTALTLSYKRALRGDIEGLRTFIDSAPSMLEFVRLRPAAEGAAMVTDKPLWNMEKIQRGFFEETAHSWEEGDYQQERMRLLYKDWGGTASAEDLSRIRHLDERAALNQSYREGEDNLDWIHRSSVALLPQLRDMGINVAYRGTHGMVVGAGTGAALGAAGGATIGSVVPGVGTAVGGAGGALGGAVTGGLTGLKVGAAYGSLEHSYMMAVSEIWGSIKDLKDGHGNTMDPGTARIIAAVGALPMAGLDMFSFGKALDAIPGIDRFLNKGAIEAATKFLQENPGVMGAMSEASRKILVAAGAEVVTEGLQEGVVIAAEERAKKTGHMEIAPITRYEAMGRMYDAGKEAFAAVLPLSVGGGTVRTFANRRLQQAQANADMLEQLHTLATESETLKNAPELAREFQKRLGEEGGAGELFIRPDAVQRVFFQTREGQAAAAALGITPEMVAESIALDTDLAVPMDMALQHIIGNERVYSSLAPDMRTSPDIMTPREAEAFSASEEGAPSQLDREGSDFLDAIFAGLGEEIAANERRSAMAEPYVQQLVNSGYTERQAQHLIAPFMANAEQLAPLFNQTPEEYFSERFAEFRLTTPDMANLTQADIDDRTRRRLSNAKLSERDPLLAAIWGRLDPAGIKNYDSLGARELTRKYGRGLFKGKAKYGLPLDELADELVRSGLLPDGSGANELLAALQDRRRYFQPVNADIDVNKKVPVIPVKMESAHVWESMKGKLRKAIIDSIVGDILNESTGEILNLSRKNAAHLISSATNRGVGGPAHIAAVRNVRELLRVAERIESYPDRKNQAGVQAMHRYFAPMRHDNAIYAVNMAVKEHSGERLLEIDGVKKLYDLKLEKKTPVLLADKLTTESSPVAHPTDVSAITIRQMLDGVNDSQGNAYFHNRGENARGYIDFSNAQAVINLFKGKKNLSTVIHEGGHFYLENLREAAQLEQAPEWVAQSWQTLQQEYGFEGFDLTEAVHERFAREFEAYARGGKAPSSRLQAAFRQFSTWLTRIYRSVRSVIGADDISADIRNVFDRLLATEQEIEEAGRQGSSVSLSEMEANGLQVTPELRDRYARAVAEAQEKAASAIEARRMVEQRRMEKQFRTEAEARIAQEPFYRAEADVRKKGGIDWRSVLAVIDEDLAEELRRKWAAPFTKGLFKESGALGFTDAAADFNVDSPQNLAGVLLSMPTRREAVDAEVRKAIAEWNQTFDGGMEYSNAMDEALALELEALTGQKQPSGAQFRAELDRRIGVKKTAAVDAEYKALKESLRKQESILREVMRDAGRAARTALREETQEAYAEGVLAGEMHEGAKRAKERRTWRERVTELKNQERAKRAALAAAYRARIERDKLTRQIRKDAVSRSVNDAFRQQILALVAHWRKLGTGRMVPRDITNTPLLKDFVTQHESLFGEQGALFPEWLLAENSEAGVKSTGDLSLEQLRDLGRAIRILAHQGRNYDRLLSFGKEVQLTEAAGEMVASMNKLAGTRHLNREDMTTLGGKLLAMLRGAASEITTMRYLFDAMDGFVNIGGPNTKTGAHHKYFTSGFQDAMGKELGLVREYDAKITRVLSKLYQKDVRKAFSIEGVPLPEDVAREWGGMFTRENVFSIALNMGNDGNASAIRRGYGWTDADLQRITADMTVAEWQAVQELWDTINELYPGLNEIYQQQNGVPLPKVEAREFTVRAADGEVTLRGGYYPLIFDQTFSQKAEEQQSIDEFFNRSQGVVRTPNPQSGMTKERKGGTLPPKLSLSVVRQHITDTIHYTTHAPILRDAYRIMRLQEYKRAFERAAGREAYEALVPWLRHIARPEGEHATQIDRAVEWMAKRGTLFVMAFNMKSALLQLSSFGSSMQEVGKAAFVKGMFQMMSRPHSAHQAVREKSAYMESRSRMLDSTMREILDQFNRTGAKYISFMGRRYTLEQFQNAQFALIRAFDAVVAYPTWIAAYDAATRSGVMETEAVRRADESVIRAQGSGGAMDVARVMRRRGFWKLATTFMSFAVNDFNRKQYYVGGFREYLRGGNSQVDFKVFAQHFALEWAVPVVFSAMMLSLGRDGELPDTEDYLWEAVGFLSMGIPIVRDASRYAENQFSGKGGTNAMGNSVGYAGIESAFKAGKQGFKWLTEDDEKARNRFIRELINTMGFVFGIGTPQLWRTLDGSEAFFVDGEGGVLAPLLGRPQPDKD